MNNKVITYNFIALSLLSFLVLCNVAIFFNFHHYLVGIGIESKTSGFLVGLSSLTAVIFYATMSARVTLANANKSIVMGILMLVACGFSYQFAHTFWSIFLIRVVNGSGAFFVMAGCMVMLVSIIPPKKSGFAFSIYSVALLMPYSLIPAFTELVKPWVSDPPKLYMVTASMLLPSLLLLPFMSIKKGVPKKPRLTTFSATSSVKKNLLQKPVLAVLLVNGVYFTLFAGLFFLFRGFADSRGIADPGFFFTVQMAVMVFIRIVAGKIFDTFPKTLLVSISLIFTALSFVLLLIMPNPSWIFAIAVIFGLGMGFTVPPLNALMFLVAKPEFRGFNSNMMMLTVHLGTFLGPFIGSMAIDFGGYNFFLASACILTLCGSIFFYIADPSKHVVVE